jgi:hypothetical protein
MRFYLLLILFSQSFLFAQEETQKAQPKKVFSIMTWNFQGRLDLAYAPWGNYGEANATIVPLTVFTGVSTEKCSYYENGKLTLLRQRLSDEIEGNETKYEKVAEVDLPMKAERISESLLLVTPPSVQKPSWSVDVLDFDQQKLPSGKFAFSSIGVSRSLELSFGESKFILPPNTSTTVEGEMKEAGRTIELSIRQGSQSLFSQQWPHVNGLRGMFFIGPRGDGVQVTRFVDFPKPVEQTLGYGLPRISEPDDENGDGFEEF